MTKSAKVWKTNPQPASSAKEAQKPGPPEMSTDRPDIAARGLYRLHRIVARRRRLENRGWFGTDERGVLAGHKRLHGLDRRTMPSVVDLKFVIQWFECDEQISNLETTLES
jgi:hypothetical protein